MTERLMQGQWSDIIQEDREYSDAELLADNRKIEDLKSQLRDDEGLYIKSEDDKQKILTEIGKLFNGFNQKAKNWIISLKTDIMKRPKDLKELIAKLERYNIKVDKKRLPTEE